MAARNAPLLMLAVISIALFAPPAAAGGGCHSSAGRLSASTERSIAIGDCAFADTVTYIEPGQSVTWTNEDPVPHTVTGAARSWGSEALLQKGDEATYTFADEGVFPYYCALHPAMVGAVVVGDAAPRSATAGAVTKADSAAPAPEAARSSAPASTGVGPLALGAAAVVVAVVLLGIRRRGVV